MSDNPNIKPIDTTAMAHELENANEKQAASGAGIDRMLVNDERAPEARGAITEDIPMSYWYSWQFLGTFAAIILAKDAGSGGFGLAAPILSNINADIGPNADITWVSLSWTLTQGISALVVGRLSDVFGRRWLFIIASLIGTAGAIWASQAQSVPQLIGATVLLGLAGGAQISYFWIISEIVPMRWRFAANSVLYAFSFTSWLGPKISYDFVTLQDVGWRGAYYLLVALNGLSTILFYLCYHPPTFKMLHQTKAFVELVKYFDWFGLGLYTVSFIAFLIGINWGGNRFPWVSAEVLGPLLGGAVGLILFILYEMWLPRRFPRMTPFVEIHFLTNIPLLAITGMTCVAGSAYYGIASVWPGLVKTVWTGLDQRKTGDLLSLFVICYVGAQVFGGAIAHFTGPKRPIIVSMYIAAPLLACTAVNPFNMNLTCIMIALGGFFLGIMEGVALTATTYPLRSQEEIGSAGGITGTIRLFVSTLATAVYNATVRNRLNSTIPANVGPAAIGAGLPESSLPELITKLRAGLPLAGIPGLTTAVEEAARYAFRVGSAQAYQTLFLVCIAFTVPGCIFCWFTVDSDQKKDEFVAAQMHRREDTKRAEQEVTQTA